MNPENASQETLTEYILYVEEKIDRGEFPMKFADWFACLEFEDDFEG